MLFSILRFVFFFKQKTAYEMRISDWSSDVCSSDLTTCVNENYFFPDVQAAVYKRHGFRARVGLPVIDFPTAWAKSDDAYFDKAGEVHDQWRDDPLEIGRASCRERVCQCV